MAACPVGRVPPDMRKDGYFMKSMKRRLLSLFMAMVMVLSLAPMALAEDTHNQEFTQKQGTSGSYTHTATCSVSNCDQGHVISSDTACTPSTTWEGKDATNHWKTCTVCKKDGHISETAHDFEYKQTTTGEQHTKKCKDCQYETQAENCSYTEASNTKCVCGRVKQPTPPTLMGIKLNKTSTTLTVNQTEKLTASAVPDGATLPQTVSWNSSDTTVATVSNDGTITAVKEGTTTITATANTDMTATCTVTVNAAPSQYTVTNFDNKTISDQNAITLGPVLKNGTTEVTTGFTRTFSSSNSAVAVVDPSTGVVTPKANGTTQITVTYVQSGTELAKATCTVTVANLLKINYNSSTLKLTSMSDSITLTAAVTDAANANIAWTATGTDRNYFNAGNGSNGTYVVSPYMTSTSPRTLTVTASSTVNNVKYTDSVNITLQISAAISLSATVSSEYTFSDVSDKGSYSVEEQLEREIDRLDGKDDNWYLDYVQFDKVTSDYGDLDVRTSDKLNDSDFASVVFTPEKKGVAEFTFTAYLHTRNSTRSYPYSGILTITVTDAVDSYGDISYTASLGEDVYFDVDDFEDFYTAKYNRGSLEYVTFGSSTSNGTLYDEDGKTVNNKTCHVDPSSRQNALEGVYFSPKSTMKKSTTVKISFTAYGTERNNNGNGDRSGTITITYLNDSASDIVYNTTAGKVTLDPKDFNEAYKQATGSKTAPSNLTIEFQNVPSNGTLTYTGGSKDKDLTKSNVKSNRYTTKNSGSYRLAQLTYTGTRGKDTIDYIAYSGGTAQFSGKVVFNGTAAVPTDVVVTYGSTGGQAVRFSQNDFVSANSAMSKATKVRFVAPANGTLLMNGASASGVDIATTLLGTVTYQPKSGFNGQDKIIFAAYDASNNTVASGTVNITVIGNPTTGTTPGGTPGGVSDVSQFKDVSATAWYRDNLATLVRKGIITGKGEGKFDPLGTVTYGEALKMVLESCGYTAALGTGSNWAINYKNLAVSRGWISSDIDLNAAISRNATAELTAKVLGVSAVTSGSPFADEANGYAAALYYTSPQIFAGSPNPNGGKPLFKNSSPLLRQEVCAVICRVSDYHTQHTTNNMPDGI